MWNICRSVKKKYWKELGNTVASLEMTTGNRTQSRRRNYLGFIGSPKSLPRITCHQSHGNSLVQIIFSLSGTKNMVWSHPFCIYQLGLFGLFFLCYAFCQAKWQIPGRTRLKHSCSERLLHQSRVPGKTLKISPFPYNEAIPSRISILVPNVLQFTTRNLLSASKDFRKANPLLFFDNCFLKKSWWWNRT